MDRIFRTFRLQPPPVARSITSLCFMLRSDHGARVSRLDRYFRTLYGTSASPFSRRLAATTGRIEFTRVSDRPFAFRCSPPRLTATQFRSTTESNSNLLTGTHTPLIRYTCKRTTAAACCRFCVRSLLRGGTLGLGMVIGPVQCRSVGQQAG